MMATKLSTFSIPMFEIVKDPAAKLERRLSVPWCHADLYYIRKLCALLDRHAGVAWVPAVP